MIPALTRHAGLAASVRALFAAGEQGCWYDPSDLSTGNMYQDSAKTTAVTAVEQPVGWIQDKSGKGNHASQSTSANRPTLSARVNLLTDTETLATQSVTTVAATYTLAFTGTGTITLSGTKTGTYSAGSNSLTSVTAGTLTLTVSGTVTKADLRVANDTGSTVPEYQRVNTSTDYDTVGFAKYLSFNGSNGFLQTTAFSLPAAPQKMSHFVVMCVTKTPVSGTAPFSFASTSTRDGGIVFQQNGGIQPVDVPRPAFSFAPSVFAYNQLAQGSGDLLQINAVSISIYPSNQTDDTNVYTAPLDCGRRNNGFGYMACRIYGLIVRAAASSTTQIANAETYLNAKMGKLY